MGRPIVGYSNQQKQLARKKYLSQIRRPNMRETLKPGNSLYESPTIDVMKITQQDIVRTSPGFDDSVGEGAGGAGNWWE
jgi:hypothetical protein